MRAGANTLHRELGRNALNFTNWVHKWHTEDRKDSCSVLVDEHEKLLSPNLMIIIIIITV